MQSPTPGSNYPLLALVQPQAGSLTGMCAPPGGFNVNYKLLLPGQLQVTNPLQRCVIRII